MTLACIVLHNLCIDMDDHSAPNWYEEFEKVSGKIRPAREVCELLVMTECRQIKDNNPAAMKIR